MIATLNAALRLPPDFRRKLEVNQTRSEVHRLLRRSKLNTVCEEARCPNITECFSNKTATFMILGDRCTRRCHFCSVTTGRPLPPNSDEPRELRRAADELGLDHVVITSVDRDDLPDLGAHHFAQCIAALRDVSFQRRLESRPEGQLDPSLRWGDKGRMTVELLTPDFKGREHLLDVVLDAQPHIFGHNIETVQRLYKQVRPQSNWDVTTSVLKYISQSHRCEVKSGMMVGLGETDDEVSETLVLLRTLGVGVVTIGQYLRPSMKHWPVDRYVNESSYARWRSEGRALGFKNIFAAPFVRSSYHAKEVASSLGGSSL